MIELIMRIFFLLVLIVLVGFSAMASEYESLDTLNSTNWAGYFDDILGYLYDSHGCLHFSQTDIYLLYKTIPPGIPLTVKK